MMNNQETNPPEVDIIEEAEVEEVEETLEEVITIKRIRV